MIERNNIEDDGANAIAVNLTNFKKLEEISLAGNFINSRGVDELSDSL